MRPLSRDRSPSDVSALDLATLRIVACLSVDAIGLIRRLFSPKWPSAEVILPVERGGVIRRDRVIFNPRGPAILGRRRESVWSGERRVSSSSQVNGILSF